MIKLRQAQFLDYSTIAKLHSDSWKKNYRGILSDHYLDNEVANDLLNTWHQRLTSPSENQYITVATSEDTIVGFCCLYLTEDPVFGSLIDNLHVSSSLQRSGIGKMLVKTSAKYICDHSEDKRMYLTVYEANTNARIAYERLGGINLETFKKENRDGTISNTCRIIWADASKLT
ncbi:GNAT family N-acetyltransferase [Ferruginibacter paludis]|uniref:GNAT family N-acetyltransferase n=1 Tax=Ferruginibacter paludis TaxID=1310417 RepID=UPI0025B3E252|nr:GNAT family N-acetyltransferase [Ferruginibacter paludis]MDN3654004.1 GNAT family N-acetyltransferase [Ferruginibacter paludis]